ncbi:DUF6879 family protein [Kitasatospora sp. NPDC001159]
MAQVHPIHRTCGRTNVGHALACAIELITDPVQVARACQVRDAAWHYATPHREFGAQVPSDV